MKKILIIDDDPTFQKIVSTKLKSLNYEVVSALDGEDGLIKVTSEKPDLILLDIKMPKMDGISFLKNLQMNKDESKRTPVFIVSNLSTMDKINDGVSLGVRGYIVKSDESLNTIVQNIELVLNPKKI
jgi:two-component system chemotaxis response regulator CheY